MRRLPRAEEIAARPVPRNRLEGAARPRPAEPRGEPRGEPRPEARAEPRRPQIQPDPQAVAAADQNLAEMAHRLEAALRKPKMVADARGEGARRRPLHRRRPHLRTASMQRQQRPRQSRRIKTGGTTCRQPSKPEPKLTALPDANSANLLVPWRAIAAAAEKPESAVLSHDCGSLVISCFPPHRRGIKILAKKKTRAASIARS